PLVQLGQMQQQLYERLGEMTATREEELKEMWEAARENLEALERQRGFIPQVVAAQSCHGAGDVPGRGASGGAAGALRGRGATVQGAAVVAGGLGWGGR